MTSTPLILEPDPHARVREELPESPCASAGTHIPRSPVSLTPLERELLAALKPFADACEHLHPSTPDNGVTLDGIEVRHWRRAFTATAKAGGRS